MIAESFGEALVSTHNKLRETYPGLGRIAVAIYDHHTDRIKTFSDSNDSPVKLTFYSVQLDNVPSLKGVAESGEMRVINDLDEFLDSTTHHTKTLIDAGFKSSLTVPIIRNKRLFGFIFFNSKEKNFFSDMMVYNLELYVNLIALLLLADFVPIATLRGALATAKEFSRYRDEETSAHLARMSRYARMIGVNLRNELHLTEEFVEFVFQYTPLHDVGKIAIPDNILLKPGKFTPKEFEVMKSHVDSGVRIIDTMIDNFNLGHIAHIPMLRNIINYHHENWDGTGYPEGISGTDIPLEARITAVADVFDALTSERPYKPAWPMEKAIDFLKEQSGRKFDPVCVDAMLTDIKMVKEIQQQFADDQFG